MNTSAPETPDIRIPRTGKEMLMESSLSAAIKKLEYAIADANTALEQLQRAHRLHSFNTEVETIKDEIKASRNGMGKPILEEGDLPDGPSDSPTISWPDYYGSDPYAVGYALNRTVNAMRVGLGLTWDKAAKLLASAPDYDVAGAHRPYPGNRIRDMKYEPRWYSGDSKYGGRWFYPSADIGRMEYALDAAQYWIKRYDLEIPEEED